MSKSAFTKKIFLEAVNFRLMPHFAQLYQKGEISIKKIVKITGIHFTKVMREIAEFVDDIECEEKTVQYSEEMSEKISKQYRDEMQAKNINFDTAIN
ncbi:MAG: hypothetical protein ACTSYI_08975 [Promethearchaeota archaeon]